jgi:predicted Zn-dependent protease
MLGELFARHQSYAQAKPFYEKAVELDPTKPVHHIRLGGMYIYMSDFDSAFRAFQTAAERFPKVPEIQYFLALSAKGKGDSNLAIEAVKRSLALKETADSNALLGSILSDRNQAAEAEKFLRKAISLNPAHFNSNHDLGRLLIRQGRFAEALPVLQKASSIMPENPDVHYELFLAHSRLKQKADADRELGIFKQLSGKN